MADWGEPTDLERQALRKAIGNVAGGLGRRGAERSADRAKYDVFVCSLQTDDPVPAAYSRAVSALERIGRFSPQTSSESGDRATVLGMIRAGFGNQNPAIITVTIETVPAGTSVQIRGVALEGLIKQHAGEKAALRLQQEFGAADG